MIKQILWDFDGVIFDSMKIKGDGFREIFKTASADVLDAIEAYHYAHGGISRFDKIRYFCNELLNQNILDDEVNSLADQFSTVIEKKLFDKNNLIEDSLHFIENNYQKFSFHIVSGAEHNELNRICETFNLTQYFISIDGSPITKDILVKNVLEKYNYIPNETILIGDAMTDYLAAKKNNISFYGYNNIMLKEHNYIETFRSFTP